MVSPFTDNPEKRVVRLQWNTPLLQHLHQKYRIRYRYLGLPGTDLIDVKLWRQMIDEVIAFEPPDKDGGGRTAFTALTRNMRKEGIPGRAYCGSFEEVVLLRRDREGQNYVQDKVVTLYNLDFCNEICSRVETREGNKVWRFEAIRQVLRDQLDCYQRDGSRRHFILMLTVRNQIAAGKIRTYLSPSSLQGDAKAFFKRCSTVKAIPEDKNQLLIGSHSWTLKTLLHNMLCSYFGNPNLSALFFPPVLYQGTKVRDGGKMIDSPMMHWVVLCRFGDATAATPEFWPEQYLSKSSIAVQQSRALIWQAQAGEEGQDGTSPNAVEWLLQHGGNILSGM